MKATNEIHTFFELQKRIDTNTSTIKFLKSIVVSLMLLFVGLSFVTLYTNAFMEIQQAIQIFFITLLIATFLSLAVLEVYVKRKEKENKRLDMKIYKILKL